MKTKWRFARQFSLALLAFMIVAPYAAGQPTEPDETAREKTFGPPEKHWASLSKNFPVWIDLKNKEVIVDGHVCLRAGQLEMFACPAGTKEHESIVAVHASAALVHTGLLAVGARPGHPVKFDPVYVPAQGTEVAVLVQWKDAEGKVRSAPAQSWIRNIRTEKEMAVSWVFGGSGFWIDEETGERRYLAEDGDLICVSNFSTATLDVPIESSKGADALMFEAFTERIPKKDTAVRLVLTPRLEKKTHGASDDAAP